MATVEVARERRAGVLEESGTLIEGVGGAATVILAILGLTGLMPLELAAIAAIAFGVALVAEGGSIASRFSRLLTRSSGGEMDVTDLGGGMSAELLGGCTGALLGLLAVLHIAPMQLVPIAVVVFGAALLLGNGATAQVSALALSYASKPETHTVAREAVLAAASAQLLVAVGAVTLGIIAIVGIHSATLTLAAFLGLGASVVLSGTAIGGTMVAILRR
jgi:hypothetical protein